MIRMTKKFLAGLSIVCLSVTFWSSAAWGDDPVLSFYTDTPTVQVGEMFEVDVMISGLKDQTLMRPTRISKK